MGQEPYRDRKNTTTHHSLKSEPCDLRTSVRQMSDPPDAFGPSETPGRIRVPDVHRSRTSASSARASSAGGSRSFDAQPLGQKALLSTKSPAVPEGPRLSSESIKIRTSGDLSPGRSLSTTWVVPNWTSIGDFWVVSLSVDRRADKQTL